MPTSMLPLGLFVGVSCAPSSSQPKLQLSRCWLCMQLLHQVWVQEDRFGDREQDLTGGSIWLVNLAHAGELEKENHKRAHLESTWPQTEPMKLNSLHLQNKIFCIDV